MKPSVIVLLATYNGEKYLREQIDSIINQKEVDVYLKVADDRSTDGTKQILEEYKEKYSNFDFYINEKNKGFTYNFIDLLFSVKDEKYDYYAFSDQDDFWLENKLISAIEKIKTKQNENGCLYCSNLKIADQDLNEYGIQEKEKILRAPRYSFLASNVATGCTIVFNNSFYKHVTRMYPENIYLHDYWLFLIALYTADYVYDFNSYILYRQHGNNQIGSNKHIFTKSKMKNFFHPKHLTSDLVREFEKEYKEYIYKDDLKYVHICSNYKKSFVHRLKLLFSCKIRKRKYNILFKVKIILGKY